MNEPLCRFLEWDSDFFGHRIHRLETGRLLPELVPRLLEECRAQRAECLYFLADADDSESVRLAQEAGFLLFDVRVTLTRTGDERTSPSTSTEIRDARVDDLPELERIAATVHEDTRFFADPRLAPRAPSLYRTWIANSLRGSAEAVLVAELGGRPIGYATGHREGGGVGRIGLVGVDPSARGRGVGRHLVERLTHSFAEKGIGTVHVVTQGRNVAAQRLYQRCGFLTSDVALWFHKWFERASD